MADTAGAPFDVGEYERVYDPSVGEDEPWYVNDHTFVQDHTGTWHLIGITHAEPMHPFDEQHLCHATAPDPLGPWTKQPFALSADAAHDERQLWAPHVLHHDDRYWMYYCAGGETGATYRIHLATSTDCWSWERHPDNPMVVDGFEARDPMVLRVGDRWVMYYTANDQPEGGHHIVAAATSEDLVHWSGRHVVYTDAMVGTGAGPTESPFVVEHDGGYLLFIGPDFEGLMRSLEETGRVDPATYRRTRVLASPDPLSFRIEDQVASLDSHALEVVRDGERWWVSHCGWGQGGVFLAPLSWR